MYSVAMAMVVACVSWPFAVLSGYSVDNSYCLCYHGDGSDGRHVCSKHTHHYQSTMLVIVINFLRLFAFVILLLPRQW